MPEAYTALHIHYGERLVMEHEGDANWEMMRGSQYCGIAPASASEEPVFLLSLLAIQVQAQFPLGPSQHEDRIANINDPRGGYTLLRYPRDPDGAVVGLTIIRVYVDHQACSAERVATELAEIALKLRGALEPDAALDPDVVQEVQQLSEVDDASLPPVARWAKHVRRREE